MKTVLITFKNEWRSLHRKKPLGAKLVGVCTYQIVYLFSSAILKKRKKVSSQHLWNLTVMCPGTKLGQTGNNIPSQTHQVPGWLWEDDGV